MIAVGLENGCLNCHVWSDLDGTVHYEEAWETEAGMRKRVQSDAFTSLLALVETTEKPPQVMFNFVSLTRGLDYVAEVRECA